MNTVELMVKWKFKNQVVEIELAAHQQDHTVEISTLEQSDLIACIAKHM